MALVEQINAEKIGLVLGVARGGLYPATSISGMLQREFYPVWITRRENDRMTFEHPIWRVDVTDELIIFPWDAQILVSGAWQLHPELQQASMKLR